MIREAPNVVTEEGIRLLLEDGYVLEITCVESAEKRYNAWYGGWTVYAVQRDGDDRKLLVVSRGSVIKAREFKTVVGLISYIHGHRFPMVTIPMEESMSVVYDPADPARRER